MHINGYIYIYRYIDIYTFIYIYTCDYHKKLSIQINVATDEGNSWNEMWHWTND